MSQLTRRHFIKSSGALMAFSFAGLQPPGSRKPPPLSFSTLGCPDWPLAQVIDFASAHHYQGIEIRGIQRELDLSKSPHFNSDAAIQETRQKISDKQLKIVGLGSSAALHYKGQAAREKAFDEAKRFIEIAHKADCPYVRVFPNNFPAGQDKAETMELMSKGLSELGSHANGSGVKVLMETHGDLVVVDDIVKVMTAVDDNKNTGLIWDVANMWTITKESPVMAHARLQKWIRHTHFKDLKKQVGGKDQYFLLGEGEVPVFEAIDSLAKSGYDGYYSFEWEKLWHPEIEAPETALAHFPVKMKEHFSRK